MPTTTGTVTSNVTADTVEKAFDAPSAPPAPNVSTAEMQRRININLNSRSSPTAAITQKLAATLRRTAKSTTESYITYGLTEIFFKSCAAQAAYTVPEDQRMGVYTGKGPPKNARQEDVGVPDATAGYGARGADSFWFKNLGLEPTFSVWSQVCFLHMYILTVKLRTLDNQKNFLDYQRYLLEHFSNEAEDKMALLHGMNAKGVRNKYLKDLFIQWRGVLYAYDQGIVGGDAVLAGAVWRNIWKADEDVDWEKVAMVVAFIRRSIAGLSSVDIQEIARGLKEGAPFWDDAKEGLDTLTHSKSRGLTEPITEQ